MSEIIFPPAEVATIGGTTVTLGPSDAVLLRVEEAARRLGISRAQTYRLIASGELSSVKIGSARRVPVHCLNEFVDRLMAKQA
jgi:excisionase family DNA binding protein